MLLRYGEDTPEAPSHPPIPVASRSTGFPLERAEKKNCANAAAARLEQGLRAIAGIEVVGRRQANAVFVRLPDALAGSLRAKGWKFYNFISAGACRFMCSWAVTDADVDALLVDVRQAL